MVVLRASSTEVLPEDLYPATLARIEEETGNKGVYWKWVFEVQGELVPGFTGRSAAPGAKARRWAQALMNEAIPDGETVDLEASCYGAAARVYVSVVNGRHGQMNRVEGVLPCKRDQTRIEEVSLRIVSYAGIPLDGCWYTAPALKAWIGKMVYVLREPADRTYIYVYDLENGARSWFICSAVRTAREPDAAPPSASAPEKCPECQALTHYDPHHAQAYCPSCGWEADGEEVKR